ncbi:neutral/alkaline non-lysosomal ceramidase N-terminal domain-containing protein [Chryseolinea sp. H1M3-3]|uniref:neutral/alkaline non-lysosomal ceramidase N-terminal domain-containing protein n=1 Tax=Chryseolinea sp. H1M3-3 TaxID=3034144 RepID=UPI0023EAF77B|nr:neutral/alkaline non-lysosomal ceramidase N-terminal domain-containing protein [Chryseolinea sp. H1M3-3]
MLIKKLLRFVGIMLASLFVLILIFAVVGIAPTDTNVDYESLLERMGEKIDSADQDPVPVDSGFIIGFSKVNLTPPGPLATAGYGKRFGKHYKSIHDSIYVRAMVIDNGTKRVAIVSADLLIIPPTVTARLEQELPGIDFSLDNTYLGATHSHNSIGNWAKGATAVLYGTYQDSVVRFITDKIKISIHEATKNMLPATIKMDSVAMPEGVYNRVTDGGPVDPMLRFLKVERSDSSKLLFLSYTAHATCLFSRDLQLSGDYPGKLTNILEKDGYALAMFMAGAVGSHGPAAPEAGWSCVDWMAEQISKKIQSQEPGWKVKNSTIEMYRVPLELSEPQPKVLHDWRLRPWLFRVGFGEYPSFLSVLRIGDIVFLSTPGDFSGEFNFAIDALATSKNVFPIVTSFNGGYIGYLTPEEYYDIDHYETQLMNWYGPGNGEYVKDAVEKLMLSVVE